MRVRLRAEAPARGLRKILRMVSPGPTRRTCCARGARTGRRRCRQGRWWCVRRRGIRILSSNGANSPPRISSRCSTPRSAAAPDDAHARVVVLNGELARKLFGNGSGVGRTVRLNDADFRVIGVLDDWRPQPAFYQQASGRVFGAADQVFLPLRTALDLKFHFTGHLSCWGSGGDDRQSDHCAWLQFWAQLGSVAKADAYRTFLAGYWRDQQTHGRLPRAEHAQLFGLMDWLA